MKWTGSYDKCHIDHIDKKRWLFAMYTICFGIMVMLVFGRFLYYGKSFVGGADGLSQVAPTMQYTGQYYRALLKNIAGKSADSDVGYVNRIWNEHLTGDFI